MNVLDERLPAAFIEIAHQPYADRFGDRMGRSIPGVFCDTEGNYGNGNGLAWSDSLAPRYLANTGRDLRLWMPLMLDDDDEGVSARARFDWFEAVSDLYAGFYGQSQRLAGHTRHVLHGECLGRKPAVAGVLRERSHEGAARLLDARLRCSWAVILRRS